MNYENLRLELHEQLNELLDKVEEVKPPNGIVDLRLSVLSVDENEVSNTLNANVELVELNDDTWICEAESLWWERHEQVWDDDEV